MYIKKTLKQHQLFTKTDVNIHKQHQFLQKTDVNIQLNIGSSKN